MIKASQYYSMYDFKAQEQSAISQADCCLFPDDIFRCIFMNKKFCVLIKISLKFVPKGPTDNNPALV